MWYVLLIVIIFLLAFSLFSIKKSVRSINRQIHEKRKIRVSLADKDMEELAFLINEKDALHTKLQMQLKQEEEQLKQSVSNISHDLRTPLTSMQGYLTLFEECDDPKEKEQYLKIIRAKTNYFTSLVQEFYDLSIIEKEAFEVKTDKVDINRIVTDCLLEKYYEFGERKPVIKTQKTPVWIVGNELVCKRIIENLIVNAIRYSDGFIECSLNADGVFTVKNTTHTVSKAEVPFLFDCFYTANKARTEHSTGLGLYIVKELLGKIGGTIETADYEEGVLTIAVRFLLTEK